MQTETATEVTTAERKLIMKHTKCNSGKTKKKRSVDAIDNILDGCLVAAIIFGVITIISYLLLF